MNDYGRPRAGPARAATTSSRAQVAIGLGQLEATFRQRGHGRRLFAQGLLANRWACRASAQRPVS